MGRIDPNPSADDDQAVTDTKKHFGHGLLERIGARASAHSMAAALSASCLRLPPTPALGT